ncbi:KTSC domain-containing protein [Alcaligenes nematophilus]|uniref:KTSC domain-containing protein n=1 Tax=Alcaligenes nematophilus TaxID=2994643 RepID=UPI0034E0DDEF
MKIHELVQGSPEWQAFRLTHHGASEAAAMLGLSKKTTRSELLRIKHTGTPKEFSDWVQVNILDYGHQVEALARPLVEEIIGDDLYPVTCSNEDEGGNLSASCDGLTMLYDTAFEHKQWNEALAASVRAGILPEEHMPQCQQIMLVTGAARVIFTVSDGTPDRLVWIEVQPDQVWFDRIRAGWAQFDRDLADYVLPEVVPVLVAEPVQSLPAVSVRVSGQIDVIDNFKVFEQALQDFLDNKLIRKPESDQDFVDLDRQIKAMKEAEEKLDAAEDMMLAQIQSVDEAKRHKNMLAKLVRDNRLIAERLLEAEKKRRREEIVRNAAQAFTSYVADLQKGIQGVRIDVRAPDFAAAIKGLRTFTSMQDKLDTALANGKIDADKIAAEVHEKLLWVEENASQHRALLADLQQLIAKPLEDFALTITTRIEAHEKAEADRLEEQREQIRKELEQEAQQLPAEAKANTAIESPAATVIENNGPASLASQSPAFVGTSTFSGLLDEQPTPEAADSAPTLRLGQINERLSPITLTADGLANIGFAHAATEKSAKLYHESDFPRICQALIARLTSAARAHAAQINQPQERSHDMARTPAAAFDDAATYQHIPMEPVESNKIKAIGYDEATRTLAVTFTRGNGAIYHYPDVDPQTHADFIGAESVGTYFGKHLQSLPFKKYHPEEVAA